MIRNDDGRPWALMERLAPDVALAVDGQACLASGASPFQSYEVWETGSFGRLYRLDGAAMAAEKDEFIYHENLVFPAAVACVHPRRALILGGGDGGSARRLLAIPDIEQITIVELDREVVRLARAHLGAIHQGSLDDPRVRVILQDGLEFLGPSPAPAPNPQTYDLILFDLTDPAGPAAALFQTDFLGRCHRALAPGGLLSLHTASPFFGPQRLLGLIQNLRAVFPLVRPFFFPAPLYGGWWGMACASSGPDPAAITADMVECWLEARGIHDLGYYNGGVHAAQFALPNFIRTLLG